MTRSARTLLAALAALLLLVAACEEAEEPADDVEEDLEEEVDEDAEEDADEDAAEDADLAVADSDLGEHLVDGDGMTLYVFLEDEPGSGESACVDECADNWPPLMADDPAWDEGVDGDLVDTIEREEGEQVTYDGWPLYGWVSDEEPGDVTGQGVEDVWYVVSPEGEAIEADVEAADEDDEDDGGY